MIRSLFNLICEDGHKHFAPNPKEWIGKACYWSKPDTTKKCDRKLRLL